MMWFPLMVVAAIVTLVVYLIGENRGYNEGCIQTRTFNYIRRWDMECWKQRGYKAGFEAGRIQGRADGQRESIEEGYDMGYKLGHRDGFIDGVEAVDRINNGPRRRMKI